MKKCAIILWYLLISTFFIPVNAQIIDSVKHTNVSPDAYRKRSHLWDNKFYRMSHVAVPLIVIGSITSTRDHSFRSLRNSYIPNFRSHYDDYLQYLPGALMLGLKIGGVEGRSSWGRMIVSDAFSVGIMALTINTVKPLVRKERPDGSSKNSFPSGHTATAFMLATMLHKEYGLTRSPLYSVAGYTIATATALSRQVNNRHWFSDVMVGAGIGILSTELGYYLADLIFKDKGLKRPLLAEAPEHDRFSYIGLQMGYGIGDKTVYLPEDIKISGKGGVTSAINGGWFFNKHWGIGGKFMLSQVTPQIDATRYFAAHPKAESAINRIEIQSLTYATLMAGVQFDHKIIRGLHVGGSVMPGIGFSKSYNINALYKGQTESTLIMDYKSKPTMNLDLTAYLMHTLDKNLGFRLFVNYNMGKGTGDYNHHIYNAGEIKIESGQSNFQLHHLNIGMEVDALLWR